MDSIHLWYICKATVTTFYYEKKMLAKNLFSTEKKAGHYSSQNLLDRFPFCLPTLTNFQHRKFGLCELDIYISFLQK